MGMHILSGLTLPCPCEKQNKDNLVDNQLKGYIKE